MALAHVILFANVEAWQPTINTVALILLAVVGNKQFKRHRRRTANTARRADRRINELEGIAEDTQHLVKRVEELLDGTSGPETKHLH